MTLKEKFGDWLKVMDTRELVRIIKWLKTLESNQLSPSKKDIFKAFDLCPFDKCKVVCVAQDPYPQAEIANGLAFGNKKEQEILSPSLEVIKEACVNFEIPHNSIIFDQTLESWARQGVLLLNSALTCNIGDVGSHTAKWRQFTSKLIRNISHRDNGLVFVLFGSTAQSFESDIEGNQFIIKTCHPAYFARKNEKMPYEVFTNINKFLKEQYNERIEWFHEYGKGENNL